MKKKINVILPCAGIGSRLNLPYSKELHRISFNLSLIDITLNLCKDNEKYIHEIIIITVPQKKDLINYIKNRWSNKFKIKFCYFNNNYFEWAGSVLSAKRFFKDKNMVLLPDTIISTGKVNFFETMIKYLENNDVVFAIKGEKRVSKIKNLGALYVKNNKVLRFCDKPQKNISDYNSYWCSFGFTKKNSEKLLYLMMKSIRKEKVSLESELINASYFYIKDYLDLGIWSNLKSKKVIDYE